MAKYDFKTQYFYEKLVIYYAKITRLNFKTFTGIVKNYLQSLHEQKSLLHLHKKSNSSNLAIFFFSKYWNELCFILNTITIKQK